MKKANSVRLFSVSVLLFSVLASHAFILMGCCNRPSMSDLGNFSQ